MVSHWALKQVLKHRAKLAGEPAGGCRVAVCTRASRSAGFSWSLELLPSWDSFLLTQISVVTCQVAVVPGVKEGAFKHLAIGVGWGCL